MAASHSLICAPRKSNCANACPSANRCPAPVALQASSHGLSSARRRRSRSCRQGLRVPFPSHHPPARSTAPSCPSDRLPPDPTAHSSASGLLHCAMQRLCLYLRARSEPASATHTPSAGRNQLRNNPWAICQIHWQSSTSDLRPVTWRVARAFTRCTSNPRASRTSYNEDPVHPRRLHRHLAYAQPFQPVSSPQLVAESTKRRTDPAASGRTATQCFRFPHRSPRCG